MTSVYLQVVIAPLLEYVHAVQHAIAAQAKSSVKTNFFVFTMSHSFKICVQRK